MSEPTYLIAQINVKDYPAYFSKYGEPVFPQLIANGAEVLVATPEVDVREGQWAGNWTVVIRFPDRAHALAFYESPEYGALKDVRMKELTTGGNLVLLPGFVPPAQP